MMDDGVREVRGSGMPSGQGGAVGGGEAPQAGHGGQVEGQGEGTGLSMGDGRGSGSTKDHGGQVRGYRRMDVDNGRQGDGTVS